MYLLPNGPSPAHNGVLKDKGEVSEGLTATFPATTF